MNILLDISDTINVLSPYSQMQRQYLVKHFVKSPIGSSKDLRSNSQRLAYLPSISITDDKHLQ
jgi:hypothetical protein